MAKNSFPSGPEYLTVIYRPMKTKIKFPGKIKSPARGEKDLLPIAKKNGTQAGNWFGPEAKKWYILIALSIIISTLLFPDILRRPKMYKFGDVAYRDIKASSEFLVEDIDLTEANRNEAVKAVLSVYDFDPAATNVIFRIKEAFAFGREELAKVVPAARTQETTLLEDKNKAVSKGTDFLQEDIIELLDISPDNKVFEILTRTGFPLEAEEATVSLVSQVFGKGIVGNKMMLMSQDGKGILLHGIHTEKETRVTNLDRFYDLETARAFVRARDKSLIKSGLSSELTMASLDLASALIKPNLTFNKRETELRKDLARKSVKPFYFKVKEGEMLVREGERITPEHLLKLSEQYKLLKQNERIGRAPAMSILICFLLFAMYHVGLMNSRSSESEVKDLVFKSLLLLIIFLVVIASNFIVSEIARGGNLFASRALVFAVPVASGAMLISIFQGMRLAAGFSLIVSVIASYLVGGGLEFFTYFFISSLVAAHGVKNCRERSVFIKTGLKVGLVSIVLALSIEALYGSFYSFEALIASVAAFIGGIFVGILATGILPLIEMSFGYTTDIKFLELASLDKPLLKELMVQAPGTYHHSVIVSNMVEAAAQSVDANPLLAKVAAYYHDIGKVRKPLYFIENQLKSGNRHEKLAPSMSSLILISHVKDGVELGKKHKLGKEIIDIIRQHHGTSLISFFYEKAKEQGEKKAGKTLQIKKEGFRYPGPRPQTKEAGLIMLADVVEAASRTLVDPTVARIQGMVQKIINKVFSDGQLDECELTLKDLHEIAKSFNKTLSGIFHHRIEYPEPTAKNTLSKKGENGNSDQPPAENSWAKKNEDKTETGESLKRLGLS